MPATLIQSMGWYAHRLAAMSPHECARRLRHRLRDAADRWLRGLRARPEAVAALARPGGHSPDARLAKLIPPGPLHGDGGHALLRDWQARQIARAERIARHRVSFFQLEDCFLGDPIDWNYEHEAGRPTPMAFAPSINYRDYDVTGDARVVWEPNRHHHLVVLARAYRMTGDMRLAVAASRQIESWIAACGFGLGMNWRSPLELALRLINWIWTFDLLRTSGALTAPFLAAFLPCAQRHVWEIARKYSYGSSANNHLIGEAAAVFICTTYFSGLRHAARWRSEAQRILMEETRAQTNADGGTREQALGYQYFVMQFLTLAGLVARGAGHDFPAAYWQRLERMYEFIARLSAAGQPPLFGDSDDGYVLDLGSGPPDAATMLSIGAVLFRRGDFANIPGVTAAPAYALWGAAAVHEFARLTRAASTAAVTSQALPESGYYLLRRHTPSDAAPVAVTFDCGELGLGTLAAHGHADALSFTLRAFGDDVLVDPGTYDYFRFPAWRQYFRSTRAHNTITIDGLDQSEMLGPFLWGRRAQARCLHWTVSADGACVVAEHDGYTRLRDPVVHRRSVRLSGSPATVDVHDQLMGRSRHDVELRFHLAEHCRAEAAGPSSQRIQCPGGSARIDFDPRLTIHAIRDGTPAEGGCVSRRYHQKAASTTLVGRCVMDGPLDLQTRIVLEDPA
jgi:uncharacterized heparinase superfamily protein